MTTYSELLAQREALARQMAEIEQAITSQKSEQRAGVLAQNRELMALHGITVAELSESTKARRGRPARTDGIAKPASKVAPKYRDPESGATWSGRGLKPRWLSAAIEAGKPLESFAL